MRSYAIIVLVLAIIWLEYFKVVKLDCDLTREATDPTLIQTKSGLLRGSCHEITLNDPDNPSRKAKVLKWLGVPFASPPIDSRRFMSTRPVEPWPGVREAHQFSPKCVQSVDELRENESEDCLYLNIYAPLRNSSDEELLPIYLWVHGGTFITGSASERNPVYAVGYSNVIIVTINYRLGPFGYMYLPEIGITGNMALLDQHMALKWIHENAASFGGDASRISLGGQSAGAFSVGYHFIYPPSWPLFKNTILESGAIFMNKMKFMSNELAASRASDILERVGCSNETRPDERLKCAQNSSLVASGQVMKVWNNYQIVDILEGNQLGKYMSPVFHLVQNGIEFNQSVKEYFETGNFKSDMNILLGNTHDEGGDTIPLWFFDHDVEEKPIYKINADKLNTFIDGFYFYFPQYPIRTTELFKTPLKSEYTVSNQTDYLNSLIRILSDNLYICPSIDFAQFYSQYSQSVNVFRYSYDFRSSRAVKDPALGVIHSAEVPLWFGECFGKNYPAEELRFSKQLIKYWSNFAKYGDVNKHDPDESINPVWPVFKPSAKTYVSLKPNGIKPSTDYSSYRCDFWRYWSNYPDNKI